MTGGPRLSRRRLGRLLTTLLAALPRLAHAQHPDQGIGGTGAVGDPKEEPTDQSIGGTGVVGTIRRFGSIYVNGLRITYPKALPVTREEDRVSTTDLKLGHVVRVAAARVGGDLVARSIAIVHEVIGPVEAVSDRNITVLGQTVTLAGSAAVPPLRVGQPVAVSGLRRHDGTIVASLVEPARSGVLQVAGPLVRGSEGQLAVGGLSVVDVDPSLVGRRVYLTGRLAGAALAVTGSQTERDALARLGVARCSVEAYVARGASGLQLGSGLRVEGGSTALAHEGLAIVTLAVVNGERLVAEKIQVEAAAEPTISQTIEQERQREKAKTDKGSKDSGRSSGGYEGSHGKR